MNRLRRGGAQVGGGDRWQGWRCGVVIGWQAARLSRFLRSMAVWGVCECVSGLQKGERIDHQICSFPWKGWRQDRVPRVRRIGPV